MKSHLLDVNVLIALAWPSHIHHSAARKWFAESADSSWATCSLTQCAFVRISSNPKIIADAVSPAQAREVLVRMTAHPRHVFMESALPLTDSLFEDMLIGGHRQVTDAYLLGLAVEKRATLVTFDRAISHLAADLAEHVTCLSA